MKKRSARLALAFSLFVLLISACSPPQTPMPSPVPQTPTSEPPTVTPPSPTSTPVPPTSTIEPSTATPQPPTPSPTPAPTRIQFTPGATSATVTGHVEMNGQVSYVLRALTGQTMEVDLTSLRDNVLLEIKGADGTTLKGHAGGEQFWRGELPSTQDYIINAISTGQEADFKLRVTVFARIQFDPGEVSVSVDGYLERTEPEGVEFGGGYVLRALEGQMMEVNISAPNDDVLLSIEGEGGVPLKRYVDGESYWRGELPATQDYFIRPVSVGGETGFNLTVTVAPLGWEGYRDSAYGFEVWYPEEFVPDPTCFPVAVRGELALDLRLEGSEYYSSTNLLDACFIVGVEQGATRSTCLEPVDTLEEGLGEEEINSIIFHKFSRTGIASGNIFDELGYRTLHGDACYEVTLLIHSGNIGVYPEGTVVEFDREKIVSKLEQVLYTFRFLE